MYDDSIKALDVSDGQFLWEVGHGVEVVRIACGTDGVLALCGDASLCAVDAGIGRLLGNTQTGSGPEWVSPDDEWAIAVRGGVVGCLLPDGSAHAVDVDTGAPVRGLEIELTPLGWDRRWLDRDEDDEWDTERQSRM